MLNELPIIFNININFTNIYALVYKGYNPIVHFALGKEKYSFLSDAHVTKHNLTRENIFLGKNM